MENCELKHGVIEQKIATNAAHITELQVDRDVHESRITRLDIHRGGVTWQ